MSGVLPGAHNRPAAGGPRTARRSRTDARPRTGRQPSAMHVRVRAVSGPACTRLLHGAPPYLCGLPRCSPLPPPSATNPAKSRGFGPRKMSVQRRSGGRASERPNQPTGPVTYLLTYVPSPRTVSIARPKSARPPARLASNEAVFVTASVRPSARGVEWAHIADFVPPPPLPTCTVH